MARLYTANCQVSETGPLLFNVRNALDGATGECAQIVNQKFSDVLSKNPGFNKITSIARILSGETLDNFDMSPNLIARFKYAPLTSCDVERSFSSYKNLLSDRRTNLTPQHLEMLLICNCYYKNTII